MKNKNVLFYGFRYIMMIVVLTLPIQFAHSHELSRIGSNSESMPLEVIVQPTLKSADFRNFNSEGIIVSLINPNYQDLTISFDIYDRLGNQIATSKGELAKPCINENLHLTLETDQYNKLVSGTIYIVVFKFEGTRFATKQFLFTK